ncbi:putative DNA-binding domain-containing protein [Maribius pontilimi]|uniref:DNA-binding domain-containing protein n=1 Tax=Palleronia pontilimi TaxID=1964209 RepID=A0A934IAQ0_9RHOB|nr:putative DNA-binding domain-containing protein [Palleronia pontilimi]MBJ3763598.1 putative DNA-binding domain-containing protein [Palleronia pontilimi]
MPAHRELQAAFGAALTGTGVPPGVIATGDVARRFAVYRNTVQHSLTDALSQRFPVIRRLVGARFFDAVAGVFIRAHPPRSPVIAVYGAAFADFLDGFPPARRLAYLPDVARLEWARGLAFHAADAAALTPAAFADATAHDPDRVALTLHPCLHLLGSDYPVVSIWRANQPGADPAPLPAGGEAALIFRDAGDVPVLPLDPPTFRMIGALAAGKPMGAALAHADQDQIARTLSTLLRHGLIVGTAPFQNTRFP